MPPAPIIITWRVTFTVLGKADAAPPSAPLLPPLLRFHLPPLPWSYRMLRGPQAHHAAASLHAWLTDGSFKTPQKTHFASEAYF